MCAFVIAVPFKAGRLPAVDACMPACRDRLHPPSAAAPTPARRREDGSEAHAAHTDASEHILSVVHEWAVPRGPRFGKQLCLLEALNGLRQVSACLKNVCT